MSLVWLLVGLVAALVVIHMARPYAVRLALSAARFFSLPSSPRSRRRHWRLANPLTSRPLYLQLPVLLLLLAALLLHEQTVQGALQPQRIGLWLLVDTSASMSTRQGAATRFAAARQLADQLLVAAASIAAGEQFCLRLSTFDQERRDLAALAPPGELPALLAQLTPRGLGTDLSLVRTAAETAAAPTAACPVTHLVVLTDAPAPSWAAAAPVVATPEEAAPPGRAAAGPGLPVLWLSVGEPVANRGFTAVDAVAEPLSGRVTALRLTLGAFGPAVATRLAVTAPDGSVQESAISWQPAGVDESQALITVAAPQPGRYTFRLTPGDAYAYDDAAVADVPPATGLRVDWRASAVPMPPMLGWSQSAVAPDLRIATADVPLSTAETPTLLVGAGYGTASPAPIADFVEGHPLLADVSFEQVERTGMAPMAASGDLPPGFTPILIGAGADAPVWVAVRTEPPAVYIPGLPPAVAPTDGTWRLAATLFANSARWLLGNRPAPALYTLTSPAAPEPADARLALHPGEGNTWQTASSTTDLAALPLRPAPGAAAPLWPWLVAVALVFFGVERGLATWRGAPWC